MTPRTRMQNSALIIIALLLAALFIAGCGDEGSGSTDSSDSRDATTTATSPSTEVEADLVVKMEQMGASKDDVGSSTLPARATCTRSIPASCSATLVCPVADDGSKEDEELCAWLAGAGRAAVTPVVKKNEACTMIFGGPQTAQVTGTIDGEQIDSTFSYANGCDIARWDAASPLWTGEVPTQPGDDVPEERVVSDPPEAFDK